MKKLFTVMATIALSLTATPAAMAFCGFYVAQAGAELFNNASKVVLVRDGDRTVITMANDYAGDVNQFAMVVPVPDVPEREDIQLGSTAHIDHLDKFTAPRLVEYFDSDPCSPQLERFSMGIAQPMVAGSPLADGAVRRKDLGVTIEAQYEVGEYDIQILSAKQSGGLLTFLNQSGYDVPQQARTVLADYISGGMKFFVARVNLDRVDRPADPSEATFLRPLRISMTTDKFMLPIRLGMVNAKGDQELFVYAITRKGRVESANYRNAQIPSDTELPPFTEFVFDHFYPDMFTLAKQRNHPSSVFLEYAWDLSWCDPCAANPPSREDLVRLGVFWLGQEAPVIAPPPGSTGTRVAPVLPRVIVGNGPMEAYITRLHVRYNDETFPQDLEFRVTDNRANFQGRYITRHPWQGEASCPAGVAYRQKLMLRQVQEAATLGYLTGWPMSYIQDQQKVFTGKPNGG